MASELPTLHAKQCNEAKHGSSTKAVNMSFWIYLCYENIS